MVSFTSAAFVERISKPEMLFKFIRNISTKSMLEIKC